MPTLRRYADPIIAQHAAAYLRQSGIIAMVVGQLDPLPGLRGTTITPAAAKFGSGHYAVIIENAEQQDEASRLLAEFESAAFTPEEGWEENAVPDLSLLDPALAPPCPRCGGTLPMDSALERCPHCDSTVDVPALLADLHGPELLAQAIPQPIVEDIPDEVVDAADVRCAACRYPLRGLAREGRCPECGEPYNKRSMLQG